MRSSDQKAVHVPMRPRTTVGAMFLLTDMMMIRLSLSEQISRLSLFFFSFCVLPLQHCRCRDQLIELLARLLLPRSTIR